MARLVQPFPLQLHHFYPLFFFFGGGGGLNIFQEVGPFWVQSRYVRPLLKQCASWHFPHLLNYRDLFFKEKKMATGKVNGSISHSEKFMHSVYV